MSLRRTSIRRWCCASRPPSTRPPPRSWSRNRRRRTRRRRHPLPADDPLASTLPLTLRQRPWFSRGALTALILLLIIALWAAVFLFGIGQVFAGDPMTKTAPASFFASAETDAGTPGHAAVVSSAGTPDPVGWSSVGPGPVRARAVRYGPGDRRTAPAGRRAAEDRSHAGRPGWHDRRNRDRRQQRQPGRPDPGGGPPPNGRGQVGHGRRRRPPRADGSYQIAGLFPGGYKLGFSARASPPSSTRGRSASRAADGDRADRRGHRGHQRGDHRQAATITGTVDPGDTLTTGDHHGDRAPLSGARPGQDRGDGHDQRRRRLQDHASWRLPAATN